LLPTVTTVNNRKKPPTVQNLTPTTVHNPYNS